MSIVNSKPISDLSIANSKAIGDLSIANSNELYSAVIHCHYKRCELTGIDIFTTEKKAIDYCIYLLIKYNYINYDKYIEHNKSEYDKMYLNNNNEENSDIEYDEDIFIQLLKTKINTIEELNDLCADYGHEYITNWNFHIKKKIVDNID